MNGAQVVKSGRTPHMTAWSEDPWGHKKNGWCLGAPEFPGTGAGKQAELMSLDACFLLRVGINGKPLHGGPIVLLGGALQKAEGWGYPPPSHGRDRVGLHP